MRAISFCDPGRNGWDRGVGRVVDRVLREDVLAAGEAADMGGESKPLPCEDSMGRRLGGCETLRLSDSVASYNEEQG